MRTLGLLLLSGSSVTSSGGTGTASGSASGGGSTATGADVQEQVLDILALKSLSTVSENLHFQGFVQSQLRTLANRVVQMGSTSSIFAALIRDWSLSACKN